MTSAPLPCFELSWLGGPAEAHVAEHRRGVDDLPWNTLDRSRFSPDVLDRARLAWTVSAHQEWCAAASFAALLRAMLEARAPLDLIGMASRFVADEVVHTELNARMAAEVGGGAPLRTDPEALVPEVDPDLDALERACALGIAVSCVGETFSLPVLAGTRAVASEPLVKAVLHRIVVDEAPHGRVGWILLDWALPRLSAASRERLAEVADRALLALEREWSGASDATLAEHGLPAETLHALGWMTPDAYRRVAHNTVRDRIVEPLRRRGVPASLPPSVAPGLSPAPAPS